MKRRCLHFFLLPLCLIASMGLQSPVFAAASHTPDAKKVSYALGMMFAEGLKKQHLDALDSASLVRGVQDTLEGHAQHMTAKEAETVLGQYQKHWIAEQKKATEKMKEENLKKDEAFMAAYAKKDGVHTLQGGILYRVETAAEGKKPQTSDRVKVDYEGRLIDGTVFDSSYKRGQPVTFGLNQVIKGWQDALSHMPQGSTWEVVIPSKLAYGEMGMPPVIGPNETLIFKIHLIDINPA